MVKTSNDAAAAISADTELVAAEAAIEEASTFADAAVSAGEVGQGAKRIDRKELTSEQRGQLSREIARRQRKLGQYELERFYESAIVVPMDVKLNNPHIASSATRFLGLTDRTLYMVNRFGSRFMSEADIDATREAVNKKIQRYEEEAAQALSQGLALTSEAKKENPDWLSPVYTSAALDTGFQVKTRDTVRLIKALRVWDQAILEFATLEFNDSATINQLETMRVRERSMFLDINTQCIRTIRAFYKRRNEAANKRSKAAVAEEQSSTPA
jgi:hypothetical protein